MRLLEAKTLAKAMTFLKGVGGPHPPALSPDRAGEGEQDSLDEGRGREFEAEHGTNLVDGANTSGGAVAVRLVHGQDQVWKAREVVEVALADYSERRLMRGERPPRTSEIFEMLKMLILQLTSWPRDS